MNLKCWVCDEARLKELKKLNQHIDEKGKKITIQTISVENDSYIKVKGKYYHEQCFREYQLSKGKITELEVNDLIVQFKLEQHKEQQDKIAEARFFEWAKEHYQVALNYHFCNRIKNIAKGLDDKVYGIITYDEFLEMYKMMENYLAKSIINKDFKNTSQRMNYELAIIINKYEDYKNYKSKLAEKNHQVINIQEKIKSSEKFSSVKTKVRQEDNDTFYVSDIHDELI